MDGQLRRQLDGTEMWQWQTLREACSDKVKPWNSVYFLQRCFIFNSKAWHMFELWLLFSTLVTQQQRRERQNVNPCINRKLCGSNRQVRSPPSQTLFMFFLPLSCPFFLPPPPPPLRPPLSLCQHRQTQPATAISSSHLLGPFSGQEPKHLSES